MQVSDGSLEFDSEKVDKTRVEDLTLMSLFKGVCGKGDTLWFWIDSWVLDKPLKEEFPLLFKLETNKKCLVRDRFCTDSRRFVGCPAWFLGLVGYEMVEEWERLATLLDGVSISDVQDKWSWQWGSHKEFSVKSVKEFLRSSMDYSQRYVFKWLKSVPKNCNIFVWRACLDRIPTRTALLARNFTVDSSVCSMCELADETVDHLLCYCDFAKSIWDKVGAWCKIGNIMVSSVKEVIEYTSRLQLDLKLRKALECIMFTACWCIWKAGNSKIFDQGVVTVESVVHEIRTIGFLWFKNRVKGENFSWEDWSKFIVK